MTRQDNALHPEPMAETESGAAPFPYKNTLPESCPDIIGRHTFYNRLACFHAQAK